MIYSNGKQVQLLPIDFSPLSSRRAGGCSRAHNSEDRGEVTRAQVQKQTVKASGVFPTEMNTQPFSGNKSQSDSRKSRKGQFSILSGFYYGTHTHTKNGHCQSSVNKEWGLEKSLFHQPDSQIYTMAATVSWKQMPLLNTVGYSTIPVLGKWRQEP